MLWNWHCDIAERNMMQHICCYFFLHSHTSTISSSRRWHKSVNCVSRNCLPNSALLITYMQKWTYVNTFCFYASKKEYVAMWRHIRDDIFCLLVRRVCLVALFLNLFLVQASWLRNKELHILIQLQLLYKKCYIRKRLEYYPVKRKFCEFQSNRDDVTEILSALSL
jgi:hypothetical protein